MGNGLIRREDFSDTLQDEIDSLNNIAPSIAYGMNSKITNTGRISTVPKFTITGKSFTNICYHGNCESISKWASYQSTVTLDATNKVFGTNGIKLTATGTVFNINNAISKYNMDITKYYFISAYLKNGNATGIALYKAGTTNISVSVTDTTQFNRVGIIVQPSDMLSTDTITVQASGTIGQYAYVDGIMINEITSTEYALGVSTLLSNYPYVDGYACLQNPFIEIKHDNIIRNGSAEEGVALWRAQNSPTNPITVSGGKLAVTSLAKNTGFYQKLKVKPNTDYYLRSTIGTTLDTTISSTTASKVQPTYDVPIATFIDDDAQSEFTTRMQPVYDAKGIKVTIGVVTDFVGTAGHLTKADLLALQTAGHEIASHSKTHSSTIFQTNLINEPDASYDVEFSGSKQWLKDNGFGNCETLIYPFANFDTHSGVVGSATRIKNIANKYFRYGVNADGWMNDGPPDNMYVRRLFLNKAELDLTAIKGVIDTAIANKSWIVFGIHSWSTDQNDATFIGGIIDYLQTKGVAIKTFKDASAIRGRSNFALAVNNGSFNSGSNTEVDVNVQNPYTTATTSTFDSLMLTEGTTYPTAYLPCKINRTVIEGKFTSDDSIVYDNGTVSGLLNWKHKTLYGKNSNCAFSEDGVGFKRISIGYDANTNYVSNSTQFVCTKYDGKVLDNTSASVSMTSGDKAYAYVTSGNKNFHLTVYDTDSGWSETINSNDDEVKAYMNGWKSICLSSGRSVCYVSTIDGSVPSGAVQATASATTTTTSITVASGGTNFVSGDTIGVISASGNWINSALVTGTPTATNIPTTTSLTVTSGNLLVRLDNGSTNITLLTWCKNNIAPKYEGYQLHYKLATPETINDTNMSISGDIPLLYTGDNYMYIDSGIILGEVANPRLSSASDYLINSIDYTQSLLKNKVEILSNIYKNQTEDIKNWTLQSAADYSYGVMRAYQSSTSFDTSATYTVDYKILATLAPKVGSFTCGYSQDMVNAINKINLELENKQAKDSTLENIVDLSTYEIVDHYTSDGSITELLPWCTNSSGATIYVNITIPMIYKKSKPNIIMSKLSISCNNSDITNQLSFGGASIYNTVAFLQYTTTNATLISSIKTYGVYARYTAIADCRNKI